MENEEQKTKRVGGIVATFAVVIAYATLMDYLHYDFLARHSEILGYYYADGYLILPAVILYFVSLRLFVLKSLFFKKLPIAANSSFFALCALIFFTFSAAAFDSAYLTQDGIKTSRETFSPSSIAGAKIGIKKSHKSYEQYIELSLIREKEPFRFNTFRGDYTIADFYERYDGALFLDGTQTPVQIETFGLEHIGEYLDGNRLITHKAARKLREFGTSGAKK